MFSVCSGGRLFIVGPLSAAPSEETKKQPPEPEPEPKPRQEQEQEQEQKQKQREKGEKEQQKFIAGLFEQQQLGLFKVAVSPAPWPF